MTTKFQIKAYVRRLAKEFNPERVVLFGSYGRGKPTADSDVDLLVIMNHRKRKNIEQAIDIDIRLDHPFPMDLIVRKPAEMQRRMALGDMFLQNIMEEGKVLYGPDAQRVGRKG